jgi:hypothetical protein
MRTSVKLILTALAASLLLSAMVSTASARSLSTSNQNIRATWTSLEFEAPGNTIRCQVTLEGSFHTRTIAKSPEALIGAITKAIVNQSACTNGSGATFNGVERYNGTTTPNTLPWHLQYNSFTGTLPNILTVRVALSRFRFGITIPFACTAQVGNTTDRIVAAAALGAGREITELTPVEGSNTATVIRRDSDPFGLCPGTGVLRGRALVTLLGATTRITITLI